MTKISFDVTNRWTGAVQFTAEIECDPAAGTSFKMGLAVRWAIANKVSLADAYLAGAYLADAYLAGANLADAYLAWANLAGANLAGASHLSKLVIDGGIRSDGYRFLLTRTEPGPWRIKAGCRNFTLEEARSHWERTRVGTPLGDETFAIINHMVSLATMREWPTLGEAAR